MFTQRSRDAVMTRTTRHFRNFTSEHYKVSKSEVFEKVIPAADADNMPKNCEKWLEICF